MKSKIRNIIPIVVISLFLCACASKNEAYFEQGYLVFNGEKYVETDGNYSESKHKLCKVDGYTVYGVVGDEDHNYIVIRSFLDNYLYVKEDFKSEDKKIAGYSIGYNSAEYSDDEILVKTINEIIEREQNMTEFDSILEQCRKEGISISVKYENDVVQHEIGYLLTYNGQNIFCNFGRKTMAVVTDEEMEILQSFEDFIDTVTTGEEPQNADEETMQWEKGYDLPVSDSEKEEAREECMEIMELISDIYEQADNDGESSGIISDEIINQMAQKIKQTGYPVTKNEVYASMENYKVMEDFLNDSNAGNCGEVVVYEIQSDGGIGRGKYIFDGENMYILSARASWNNNNKSEITYISYNRIKEWQYSSKGFFSYELCVPKYPEVTEVVNGSCLVRVKPMDKKMREISEKCVLGLGYQGNNLLCSNWDTDNMEGLDYNGMYEFLYVMKYQETFNSEDYQNGIPKEEFESLIMEYLPVTAEQIRQYAAFDEKNNTYMWQRQGANNYAPTSFGTSIPEVTDIRENEDGTTTLTVDAVCDMISCDDAVITHELTVKFADDGSFMYLGNKILGDGLTNIPDYKYRCGSCDSVD